MAEWKKVVVSGSSAALSEVLLDTALSSSMGGTGLTSTQLNAATGGQILALKTNKTGFEFVDDSTNLPEGVLSSSAQIAVQISGAFGPASASFSTRVTNLETDSGSFSTRVTNLETDSGSFSTRITDLKTDSGSFSTRITDLKADSGSFSTRVASNSSKITNLQTDSGSFSTRVTTLEAASGSFSSRVTNLEDGGGLPDGVLSSSAQIKVQISGSSANKLPLAGGTMTGGINMGSQDITNIKNIVVGGDLSVAGTASFSHATNLSVADKYILLSSGSTSAGDGGIVIQQAAGQVGELFGFDALSNRFGITGSFDADTSADFAPDAFLSMVISGSDSDPNNAPDKYKLAGNIFAAQDGTIYIYG